MTLDKAALKENRSLHEHPTSSAPDNSAVHTASKNSTPQRMISKKFRASPAKNSQASSRVRTRSRGPLNTPNPKAPEGSRTSRKSRGETEADHPRGSPPNSYHPNTEEKSLSDTDVKTVSVMQAEEERGMTPILEKEHLQRQILLNHVISKPYIFLSLSQIE